MILLSVNKFLLELLLLNQMSLQDTYGYELATRVISGIEIASGRIYSSLRSLNRRGMIIRESKIVNGKVRIYYSITTEGDVYRQNLQRQLEREATVLKELILWKR